MLLVLLDTNIFVIDHFFPRDERHGINRQFLESLGDDDAGLYIFTLFELCGISSFNLSQAELTRWMYNFNEVYGLTLLPPLNIEFGTAIAWFREYQRKTFDLITRKIDFGDSMVLQAAEDYQVDAIVTWNKKHFVGRTHIPILTPEEYLNQQEDTDD